MIETFHLSCTYMKMLFKKMDITGLADILLEAGLIASSSLSGVKSGTNYSRSTHCHKALVEDLERILFDQFLNMRGEAVPFQQLAQVTWWEWSIWCWVVRGSG